jgi:D-xylose transport system substrate-binding protein
MVALCLGFAGAACQSTGPSSPSPMQTPSRAAATRTTAPIAFPIPTPRPGCRIGVAWNNSTEERVRGWYEPAIKGVVEAGGGHYIMRDANSAPDVQNKQVQELIDAGIDALIVLPQDPKLIKPAVDKAVASGIPVVALDRAILDANALFVGTDQILAGAMEAAGLFQFKSSGRFIVIKGDSADLESNLLRQGMTQAGLPDVGQTSSTLVNVGETFTPNWDPTLAQTEMEGFLRQSGNNIDFVLVESDGMADGVYRALEKLNVNMEPPSPVSFPSVMIAGRGGDPAGLNRLARGTQVADVWENLPLVGKIAGEAALALCTNPHFDQVTTSAGKPKPFAVPEGPALSAVLLNPVGVYNWNLEVVLDANWISKDVLCNGVKSESEFDVCH